MIRTAAIEDLPSLRRIYTAARAFMAQTGNPTQWGASFPPEDLLREDIRQGRLWVVEKGGAVRGAFAFLVGEDPTYQVITEGHWRSDSPYGTVHRLASSGRWPGVSRACFTFCKSRIGHVRADTHAENKVMQRALEANGFVCCGVIHVEDTRDAQA